MNLGAGPGDVIVSWRLLLLVGGGALGVVLLIGLLALLDNPRTRGKAALLLLLPVLVLGAFVLTIRVVRQRSTEEPAVREATEAMLRLHTPGGTKEGDVTVVLSPPDSADAGKAPDDRISVKVQKDQGGGKGTIIYIKANRMLESFGKNLLETIRHSSEKETEPAKSSSPAAPQVLAANSVPAAPGGIAPPAKAVATGVPKPSPVTAAKKAPPAPAMSPAQTAKRTPAAKAPSPGDAVYEETVTAYGKTEADAEATLDDELQRMLSRYVERRLGEQVAAKVQLPTSEIRKYIVSESRDNVQLAGLGPMVRLNALVQFDLDFQIRINEECIKAMKGLIELEAELDAARRLGYLGGGLGGVLLLLSVIYGYLKIDLATAGAYRWRLRLAAAAILLGMVAAGIAFVG